MTDLRAMFGPRNEEEKVVFAAEGLLADVQLAIQTSMHEQGVTKSQLAARLGCTPSNITQLLSEDARLKVQTVAKIFHALGMTCEFRCYPHGEAKDGDDAWRRAGSVHHERQGGVVVRYTPAQRVQAHNSNNRRAIAA
jgi:ribosome-binding protein aMBF1 (putative translation factor)